MRDLLFDTGVDISRSFRENCYNQVRQDLPNIPVLRTDTLQLL